MKWLSLSWMLALVWLSAFGADVAAQGTDLRNANVENEVAGAISSGNHIRVRPVASVWLRGDYWATNDLSVVGAFGARVKYKKVGLDIGVWAETELYTNDKYELERGWRDIVPVAAASLSYELPKWVKVWFCVDAAWTGKDHSTISDLKYFNLPEWVRLSVAPILMWAPYKNVEIYAALFATNYLNGGLPQNKKPFKFAGAVEVGAAKEF